jgi:hypothetical protein
MLNNNDEIEDSDEETNINDVIDKVEQLKRDFYAKQSKNTFFKTRQKMELAAAVSSSMNIEELIQRTVYIVKDTNKVFLDYIVFKTYAHPSNYDVIVRYILQLLSYCIEKFGNFEVHVNMDTFSVSACHRYKTVIETYINECMKQDTPFSEKLIFMRLYNIPSIIDNIQKLLNPLIFEEVKKKIDFRDKNESPALLAHLFN